MKDTSQPYAENQPNENISENSKPINFKYASKAISVEHRVRETRAKNTVSTPDRVGVSILHFYIEQISSNDENDPADKADD